MMYFVRTHKFVPGPRKEAIEFLRKLAKCTNEKWPEHPVELLTNRTGAMGQVRWVASGFESLADFEEHAKKWWSDEDIKAIIAEEEGRIYFTDDVDTLYDVVEL